jgi:hypothetical protein
MTRSTRTLSRLPLLASLLTPAVALAQPAAPGPTPALQVATRGQHQHDGFFLRMMLGLGGTSMKGTSGPTELKVSGSGGGVGIALGGAVSPNLVVFGEIVDSIATNPEVELQGTKLGRGKGSAGIVGIGPGLAYYFDNNLYLSGTVAFTRLIVQDDDGKKVAETDYGPGASLVLGKEWWVSDNWGLGVALHAMFARMNDHVDTSYTKERPVWNAAGVNVLFSASFN